MRAAGRRILELARDLDLEEFLRRPTGSLSAGQRTRVALAKALLNRPRLLLLDEPTASLIDTGDVVRGYLERYRKESGATIMLASHNMAEVERLCDYVLMMRAGRIVDRGAPRQLINRYGRRTMEEVFLDIARSRAAGIPRTRKPAPRERTQPNAEPAFSWRRVGALLLRHLYVLRSSWPRLLELAYWPTVQMILWGFVLFFLQHSSWVAQAAGVLISAVVLWDILFRSNLGVSVSFMEEMWARNLSSLFVSPMRPHELVVSLAIMSLIRTVISVLPAVLLAPPLFGVSVFALGLPLAAFSQPAAVRLVHRTDRIGAGPSARAGRREPGVGRGVRAGPA